MAPLFGAPCPLVLGNEDRLADACADGDSGALVQSVCAAAHNRGLGTCIAATLARSPAILREMLPNSGGQRLVVGVTRLRTAGRPSLTRGRARHQAKWRPGCSRCRCRPACCRRTRTPRGGRGCGSPPRQGGWSTGMPHGRSAPPRWHPSLLTLRRFASSARPVSLIVRPRPRQPPGDTLHACSKTGALTHCAGLRRGRGEREDTCSRVATGAGS